MVWGYNIFNEDKLSMIFLPTMMWNKLPSTETQEMARVNTNILGINKLKWTGMGEFNSDAYYIYYMGKNP